MPIVQSGLIGYWNAKQGLAGTAWQNLAPGTSGKYNGTLVGSPTITAGQYTTLNGTTQYVTVPTIQAADKGTSYEVEMYLLSAFDNTGGTVDATGALYFPVSIASSDVSKVNALALKRDGTGYELTSQTIVSYTFAKSTLIKINFSVNVSTGQETLYINDVQVRQEISPATPSNLDIFRIGAAAWDGSYPFKGQIYSVKLYNRILTSAERTQNTGIGVEVGLTTTTNASVTSVAATATASAMPPSVSTSSRINVQVNAVMSTAAASALVPSLTELRSLNVVAHQDDDLGGLNPDLWHDIQNAGTTGTIISCYLTAGDAGNGWGSYAQSRELGMQASYAWMAGMPNSWTTGTMTFETKTVAYARMNGTNIYQLYVRLADGNNDGFSGTGMVSLKKLWQGTISTMSRLDTGQTFTKAELLSFIATLIDTYKPISYRHNFHAGTFGDGEGLDHTAAGYFAYQAVQQSTWKPKTTVSYRADTLSTTPGYVTITAEEQAAKEGALDTYVAYDSVMTNWRSDPDIVADMSHIWRYPYSITTSANTTVTSVIANATAGAAIPSVNAQKQVIVQNVIANAISSAIIPSISVVGNVTITGVIASSSTSALIPSIGSMTNITVNVVSANVSAIANYPNVETVRNVSINAAVLNAAASAFIPSTGSSKNIQIAVMIAAVTANAVSPSISISLGVRIDTTLAIATANAINPILLTDIFINAFVAGLQSSGLPPIINGTDYKEVLQFVLNITQNRTLNLAITKRLQTELNL